MEHTAAAPLKYGRVMKYNIYVEIRFTAPAWLGEQKRISWWNLTTGSADLDRSFFLKDPPGTRTSPAAGTFKAALTTSFIRRILASNEGWTCGA